MLGNGVEFGRIAGGSHIADELDVPAKRQPRDFPPCSLAVGPTDYLAAEPDRERLRRNTEQPGDEIMAELLKENERAEHANECDQDQPEGRLGKHVQLQLAFIMARTDSRVTRSTSSTSSIERGTSKFDSPSASST